MNKVMTYAFYDRIRNWIKIGRTIDLVQRKRDEECDLGAKLEVIATFEGDIERFLLDRYENLRPKDSLPKSEWREVKGELFNLFEGVIRGRRVKPNNEFCASTHLMTAVEGAERAAFLDYVGKHLHLSGEPVTYPREGYRWGSNRDDVNKVLKRAGRRFKVKYNLSGVVDRQVLFIRRNHIIHYAGQI